jgi:ankyrin repeat protein
VGDLSALIELAKTGDLAGVRRLLAATPALASARTASGDSALMAALYRGHLDIVEALIATGAALDAFAAAATGQIAALQTALSRPGAVREYSYDGWTPLHLAAFFGQLAALRLLVDAGADVRAVSTNGLTNTPLHAATAGKHADAALLLLEHGADPDATDAGGHTARTIARENQLDDVLRAMER